MKPTTVTRKSQQLAAGVRDLVRHAAESMGLSIEIWDGPNRPPERLHLGNACSACEQSQARLFDRCRKRRTWLSRREAAVPLEMAEKCPLKLRLSRLGGTPGSHGPTLFAFGYEPAGEETKQDDRVLSFLRDLRRMLEDHPEVSAPEPRPASETAPRSEEIELLQSVSGKLARTDDLHRTIVEVLAEWRSVLDGECAVLWLRDRTRLEFAFAPGQPVGDGGDPRHVWESFARRLADTLERSGSGAHAERLPASHPIARALGAECDCVAVALGSEGTVRGVLCGLRRVGRAECDAQDLRLLHSLASQLGLALANADLEADLKGFLTNTVRTLVSAIDAKDSYTAGHSERVNIVSMLLGNEMNLDLEDLEALYWGALLHDVGKIGMPESILNKPAALDEMEIEIVKKHPERGWEMLHAIHRLRRAADGVRHHHERWDGTGYPLGLAADAIPVIARIIAVADAFDAIISNRSYRRSRPASRAVEVIEESCGTQFDPTVVEALRRLLPLLEKHQWVLMSGQKVSLQSQP